MLWQQKIVKDGTVVFESAETSLAGFLAEAYQQLGEKYPKFYKMDHLSKLGWLGTEYLLSGAFNKAHYQPEEIGLVLSNANSSLDADIRYLESVKEMASPALFVYTLPNIVIGEISIRHNFKGENAFFHIHCLKFSRKFKLRICNVLHGNLSLIKKDPEGSFVLSDRLLLY